MSCINRTRIESGDFEHELTLRATSPDCDDGTCPNIRQHGTAGAFRIQGYAVQDRSGLNLPEGEDVIEIHADVVAHLLAQLK
jgi:hypothetical protein